MNKKLKYKLGSPDQIGKRAIPQATKIIAPVKLFLHGYEGEQHQFMTLSGGQGCNKRDQLVHYLHNAFHSGFAVTGNAAKETEHAHL